jgi:hypothetical protein
MRTRKSGELTRNVGSTHQQEVVTTDLLVLQQKLADLNDLWEWGVMDYSVGTTELQLNEAHHAAYVYFRAVSALEKFDAEYVPAKAAIARNFDLALRMSGLTKAHLEEFAEKLASQPQRGGFRGCCPCP